jgi:hypothetical protein
MNGKFYSLLITLRGVQRNKWILFLWVIRFVKFEEEILSYGPPWAHYLGGYQDRLLGGPLGLPGLRYTAPEGMEHKDYTGVVLG